jgi:subtilisin family serine protease
MHPAVPVELGGPWRTPVEGPLDVVRLTSLTEITNGRDDIAVGLIDGPVLLTHPGLARQSIRDVPGRRGRCVRTDSAACLHGTFVAGILCARRDSGAPGICPGCTVLMRPIYTETDPTFGGRPSATSEEVAEAIADCVNAGARVINLSSGLGKPSPTGTRSLGQALDYATSRSVIIVAAAGNQGLVGNSVITSHTNVIPVAACDMRGRPLSDSNLGRSIGLRGLMAPGLGITSLGANGGLQKFNGTSAAAPFVTGTVALLFSLFPNADSNRVRLAILQASLAPRRTIVPPLLNAWAAYQSLSSPNS